MTIKTVIWGTGIAFSKYINYVRYYQAKGEIEVMGVTSNDNCYVKLYEFSFIPKKELAREEIQLIIAMTDTSIRGIEEEVCRLSIDAPVIAGEILGIPSLSIRDYLDIKNNPPSVICSNCWGGILYHRLKLPFMSPFINMFLNDVDFLHLLSDFKGFMSAPLEFVKTAYEEILKREYPVCRIGGIYLHFNHYLDFDDARECWERRITRINWNRLLFMMWTEDENAASQFLEFPYEHRVCFTTARIEHEDVCHISREMLGEKPLWEAVNGTAAGRYHLYDPMAVLCDRF